MHNKLHKENGAIYLSAETLHTIRLSQNTKKCINKYKYRNGLWNIFYAFLMFNTIVKFAILTLLQETPKGFSVIRDQNYSCNQKGFQSNNHLILVLLALGFFTKSHSPFWTYTVNTAETRQ